VFKSRPELTLRSSVLAVMHHHDRGHPSKPIDT